MSNWNNELSQLETISHQLEVLRKAGKCTNENNSISQVQIGTTEKYEMPFEWQPSEGCLCFKMGILAAKMGFSLLPSSCLNYNLGVRGKDTVYAEKIVSGICSSAGSHGCCCCNV